MSNGMRFDGNPLDPLDEVLGLPEMRINKDTNEIEILTDTGWVRYLPVEVILYEASVDQIVSELNNRGYTVSLQK